MAMSTNIASIAQTVYPPIDMDPRNSLYICTTNWQRYIPFRQMEDALATNVCTLSTKYKTFTDEYSTDLINVNVGTAAMTITNFANGVIVPKGSRLKITPNNKQTSTTILYE